MNARTLLIAATLLGAGFGAAQAASANTPGKAPPPATAATPAAAAQPASTTRPAATAKHATKAKFHAAAKGRGSAIDRAHERVAFSREAEQRRWIGAELQRGRLDRAQAASLWDDAADLAREQAMLTRRGHESVNEALALSHRQDLLDWSIRSGDVAYAPLSLRTLG